MKIITKLQFALKNYDMKLLKLVDNENGTI